MYNFRPKYCLQPSWMMLLFIILFSLSACSSTGLTKKQRETMEHHVHLVADAIYISAEKIKKSLFEYYSKKGGWPSGEQDKREIFRDIDSILAQHNISGEKILEVDGNDIIVEYYSSKTQSMQFPVLLESWVIVFSNKAATTGLSVAAIYPNWRDSEQLAKETSYDAAQIDELKKSFREHLKEKLDTYNLQLNENIDNPA